MATNKDSTVYVAQPKDLEMVVARMKVIDESLKGQGFSKYGGDVVNWDDVRNHLHYNILNTNNFVVFFSKHSVLIAIIEPCWYNMTGSVCSEVMWLTSQPDMSGWMVRALLKWAREKRATSIFLTSQNKDEKLVRFMTKLGFQSFSEQWKQMLL